jgi:hypothetical protein
MELNFRRCLVNCMLLFCLLDMFSLPTFSITAGIISLSLFIQAWLNLVKRIEAYDWYMELFIIPCWMRPISYKPSPERRKGMLAFTGRLSYTPSHRSDSSPELQVQVNNLINVSSCLANILCKVKNSPMCEYHILFESNRSLSLLLMHAWYLISLPGKASHDHSDLVRHLKTLLIVSISIHSAMD